MNTNLKMKIEIEKNSVYDLLKLLNEKTKEISIDNIFDNNQSLACSIILDNNLRRKSSDLSLYNNNNNNKTVEKILNKYEDKIFFYETLYNFINIFATKTKFLKINDFLQKDNPKTLGKAIEIICKEYYGLQKKIKNILNQKV